MKKMGLVLGLLSLFILDGRIEAFADEIVWQDIGRGNSDLRTVLVDLHNPRYIYIGSNKALLKSEDAGDTWRDILSVRGQNNSVNFLFVSPQDKNALYAATGNGLYRSNNQGRNWKRIFKGKSYLESQCTTLAILPTTIYLGTQGGLFISEDQGRSWVKAAGSLGNSQILAIAYNLKEPHYLYVASVDGVFKTKDSGQSWEKIFVVNPMENNNNHDEEAQDEDAEEARQLSSIRYISLNPNNLNHLYLATSQGVYLSQDKGQSWNLLSDYGLLSKEVQFLLVSPKSAIYAVTKSGIFEYKNERWYELSLRLVTNQINFLALDNQDNLYAACDKGLFKVKIGNFGNDATGESISLYFKDEPKIGEVQQAAIKYAEVQPGKIKEWRKQAKIKAILPKLTVGLDRSKSTNYEIYTSATTRYVYEGPYDRSNGWDVTLSWDLSELIWNDDQTNIDVRSKLMVQLRDDILDEVTKLYFERIRVKMELNSLSLEERKKRFEKELRLQELTASLDAFTGGYFSQHLKSKTGS
jgi:hypothetical protein